MYNILFFAKTCYRSNFQIKELAGRFKWEAKVPLTREQKYIYFGTNRQQPLPKPRWYNATANYKKTTPTNISDIWNKRPPESKTKRSFKVALLQNIDTSTSSNSPQLGRASRIISPLLLVSIGTSINTTTSENNCLCMTNKNENNNGDKSLLSTRSDARSASSVRSVNSINRLKEFIQGKTLEVQWFGKEITEVEARLNKFPDIPDLSWLQDEADKNLLNSTSYSTVPHQNLTQLSID